MDPKAKREVEEEKEPIADPTLGEKDEEPEDDEDDEGSKDDYQATLDELNQKESPRKSKYTEKEKAEFSLQKTAERLKELGGDPTKVLGIEVKKKEKQEDEDDDEEDPSPKYVTSEDLEIREARREIKTLSDNPSEQALILWYVENKGLSVADAHILANKGRVKIADSERKRKESAKLGQDGSGSQKLPQDNIIKLSPETVQTLNRRGLFWNKDTKRYEGKKTYYAFNAKTRTWEGGRLSK